MSKLDGFKHGINLGGWLSQCKPVEEHYSSFIKEKDIQTIAEWGLDHVRLPVDYELFMNDDGTFKEQGFIHIQNAIDWCRAAGINMILDLHKTPGYSFYSGENEEGLFDSERLQGLFYDIWTEFAKRFGKYEDMLCFELLNEVTEESYSKPWNRIAGITIEKIREICPTIRILVGSYWNNHVATVRYLDPPRDENIIYNFHCYEPLVFTHQGAHWIPTMDMSFRMNFDATFAEYDVNTKAHLVQAGDSFGKYPADATPDESYFEALFEDAIKVAEERGTELYCGEYGVIENADPEEAMKWFRVIEAVFDKHGIGRAVWSYKEMNFGVADARMNGVRAELLKIL